jgi:hypothetical protein
VKPQLRFAIRAGLVGAAVFAVLFSLILVGANRDEEWVLALLSLPTSIALGPLLGAFGSPSLPAQRVLLLAAGCINWFVVGFVLSFLFAKPNEHSIE